jgi:threonylcarbamoyladenosine tRNA methylthiotransferase MtaB
MPKVAFTTLGCKVNQFESEVMEGLFKAYGYEVVAFDGPADVYVINTCSVTHLGEKKSRQLIRRATRNPGATVVVTGCYAQVSAAEIEAIEGVDVIVGTQDRQRIVELAEEAAASRRQLTAVGDIMAARDFEDISLLAAPGRTRAFLKIQEGCSNFCSYCIIPYARGPLRSRPLTSVAGEAAKLTAAGFKEIVLTGIHLGAYGQDLGGTTTLADAVKAVLAVDGLVRLRLGSLESVEVADELISLMQADERLCRQLHLPLQAGDDTVLRAMNRHYTTADYLTLIESIQARVADIAITTDVIVGFPGETAAQFASTLNFVDGLDLARIHVFPYSQRQGTPAAAMSGQVGEATKKERAVALQRLADDKATAFRQKFLGREMPVLFEMGSGGTREGLTSNYLRVFAAGDDELTGTIRTVRLERRYRDGLWGRIVG